MLPKRILIGGNSLLQENQSDKAREKFQQALINLTKYGPDVLMVNEVKNKLEECKK